MSNSIKSFAPGQRPVRTDHSSVMWVGVVVIIIAVAFGAGWALSKFGISVGQPEPVVEQPTDDVVVEEETPTPTVVDVPGALTVEWVEVGGQKSRSTNYEWNATVFGDNQLMPEDGIGPKAFSLGTIKGGQYDGYELQSYIAGLTGMGIDYANFYLLVPPAKDVVSPLVVLDSYAFFTYQTFTAPVAQTTASAVLGAEGLTRLASYGQNVEDPNAHGIILDTGSKIAELEQINTVKDIEGRTYNLLGVWQRMDYPDEISLTEPTTKVTLENGQALNLYNGSDPNISFANNIFYYIRQDGRTVWFDLDLGFSMTNGEDTGIQGNLRDYSIGVPQLTWSDGTKNTASYLKGIQGGCGQIAGLHVVDISEVGELKDGGTLAAGKIYVPVSFDTEYFKQAFESWKAMTPEGETRTTIEQFAASHPFFYFQDSFGRWIEFMNTGILPMAECGKPVIYLYPEKTTDLDVQLYPQGGFTYTEPVYNNGWRVTASPDGTLVNRDDGQVYPYLFWEGRGGMYVSPNRYWVVKQSGVHDFLVSTLAKLGLNTKETADFIEFWEPRMQDSAYYKIGFYGTSVMNQLAPLSISEMPDTLIRILMDYQPLDAPIKANPPALLFTPERTGFTVVEWGGVLR